MELVQALQIVTIVISVLSLVTSTTVTILSNKRENYNAVITESRLEFMKSNRDRAAEFVSEIKNAIFQCERGLPVSDLKSAYKAFEHLKIFFKSYNAIDKRIIDEGERILDLTEQMISGNNTIEELRKHIADFEREISVYDDADWRFIKQQFNGTRRTSDDFDKICDDVKSKYE